MLSKLTSHDAMQIKISFAAAYDFNQLIHTVCSPPHPAPPREKNSFPVHPWWIGSRHKTFANVKPFKTQLHQKLNFSIMKI